MNAIAPDTLELVLADFDTVPGCQLQVQRATFDAGTGVAGEEQVLMRIAGRPVCGKKAFHNDEVRGVYLDLAPLREWENDGVRCKVHFSVPKVANGSNHAPVEYRGVLAALDAVERHLREIGVHTNLRAADIRRLDTFRNVVAAEPYICYHRLFELFAPSRMAGHEFESGYRWDNSQWELCVYDKRLEMQRRKVSTAGCPANTIRFEKRLLNRRKVSTASGLRTAGDLLAGYDTLAPDFRAAVEKQLFSRAPAAMPVISLENAIAGMQHFKDSGCRNWLERWFVALAASGLLDSGSLETVRRAAGEVAGNRMTPRRMIQQIERLRLDVAGLGLAVPSRRTLAELYEELSGKVLAA